MRRKAAFATLVVLSLAAMVGLTQCNLSSDKVTGLNRSDQAKSPPGACISECAHKANDEMAIESALHVQNVQACNGDQTCLDQEEARHNAAVDAIQDGRKRCQDECHHQQGGGNGH